ncbi:MAG: hypothetical protein AAF899_15680, partial [Pseudomonadota bacterium]
LPAARPARVAAAAPASGPVEPAPADAAADEDAEAETDTAEAPAAPAGTGDEAEAIENALAEVLRQSGPAGEVNAPRAQAPNIAQQVTRGEREALSIGLQGFFSYAGNRSDRDLAVVVEVAFNRDGTIASGPTQVIARGGDNATRGALFQSARRAVVRAAAAGVFAALPAEKYAAWQRMEITFTPDERVDFSS